MAEILDAHSERGFPFSAKEIRNIVYEFCEAEGILDLKENMSGMASRGWLRGFFSRYPHLSMKTAKNLSVGRAIGGNKEALKKWYNQYEAMLEDLEIDDPRFILNLDETGVSDVLEAPKRKYCGRKNVPLQHMVSGEKGERSTIAQCVNGLGERICTMLIHKGVRFQDNWREGKPYGFLMGVSPKGHINKKLLIELAGAILQKLHKMGILGRKILLLLDQHFSHLFNWHFLTLMRDYEIHCLSFTPHTTHMCQPLDSFPFANFKEFWNRALRNHIRQTGGRKLSKREYWSVLAPPLFRSFSHSTIVAAFKDCGVWPPDLSKIKEAQVKPAEVTAWKVTNYTPPRRKQNSETLFIVQGYFSCCLTVIFRFCSHPNLGLRLPKQLPNRFAFNRTVCIADVEEVSDDEEEEEDDPEQSDDQEEEEEEPEEELTSATETEGATTEGGATADAESEGKFCTGYRIDSLLTDFFLFLFDSKLCMF